MDCKTARRNFSVHLDRRLNRSDAARLRDHLDACDACAGAYSDYEQLFSLVRGFPATTTDAPAPYPDSARRFAGASAPQTWRRVAASAAAAILIVTAGYVGYEVGKPDMTGERSVRTVAESTVRLPSQPAGRRLRRLHDGVESLSWAILNSEALGDPAAVAGAIRTVSQRVPIREDARYLEDLDERSLHDFTAVVHDFSDVTQSIVVGLREILAGNEPVSTRMERARRFVCENDRAAEALLRVRDVAKRFEPLPFDPPERYGILLETGDAVDPDIARLLLFSAAGQREQAVDLLGRVFAHRGGWHSGPFRSRIRIHLRQADSGSSEEQAVLVEIPAGRLPLLVDDPSDRFNEWRRVFRAAKSGSETHEVIIHPRQSRPRSRKL